MSPADGTQQTTDGSPTLNFDWILPRQTHEAARRNHHCTFIAAFFVWLVGEIWAITELGLRNGGKLINRQTAGQLAGVFLVIIGFQLLLGFLHQSLAFASIHGLDTKPDEWTPEFPNWLGTRFELFLRMLIVFSLLSVGGEIPILVKHIAEGLADDRRVLPMYVYPLCVSALYTLLTIWDFWGILRAPTARSVRNALGFRYWFQFLVSDFLAASFWISIFIVTAVQTAKDYRSDLPTTAIDASAWIMHTFPIISAVDSSIFLIVPPITLLASAIVLAYRFWYMWKDRDRMVKETAS